MPKLPTPRKSKPLYRTKAPKPPQERGLQAASTSQGEQKHAASKATDEPVHYHPIAPAHFKLRDDGGIEVTGDDPAPEALKSVPPSPPKLIHHDEPHGIWLYHGNSLELLDAIYAKYGEAGRFDCIFADPPYFLSNGGISCHAGKMVKVDKGDWDKSRGPELNHEFNTEWLRRCQRVLKPNGTIWVSGTHHVIFSIGYAMQQLGFKILNDIAWEKPNPPPNLSCRYFTHSTETILWAAKNEKSKHLFNYDEMRKVTGKQMKTVWTMTAPGNAEKTHGKHPTQKPIALIERCLLAATNPGDSVLDPFLGGGTTAVACARLKRECVGVEADVAHANLSMKRVKTELEQNADLFTPPPHKNSYKLLLINELHTELWRLRMGICPSSSLLLRRANMILGGIGGQSTLTGLNFEREVDFQTLLAAKPGYEIRPLPGKAGKGVFYKSQLVARCFKKNDFYEYLKEHGIDWRKVMTKKLLPDDALLVIVRETLFIIEVKFQQVAGSVDEKLQTCDFKRKQYLKLVTPLGLMVEYVYVLSDWFKDPRYKDVLDYIQSVNCHYKFGCLPLAWLGLPDPDTPSAAGEI